MNVHNDPNARRFAPGDGLEEEGVLSLNVRLSCRDVKGPIANGNADCVQSRGRDGLDVFLRN